MAASRSNSLLWAAHVLPLYVIRFDLNKDEAIQLLERVNLLQWVKGGGGDDNKNEKAVLKNFTSKFSSVFTSDADAPGQCHLHESTFVPDQRCDLRGCMHGCLVCVHIIFVPKIQLHTCRCISSIYKQMFGIDLVSVYNNQGVVKEDEGFIDWYIGLTHLLCTSLQMLCMARVSFVCASVSASQKLNTHVMTMMMII